MMMTTTIRATKMMIMVENDDYDDENDDNDGCNTDDKMLMIKKIKIATLLYNDSGDRVVLMTYRCIDETRRSS
jgi:hypothetical protein